MWKEVLDSEGTSLALSKHILAVILCTWAIEVTFGGLLFLKPLTPEEFLCAAEMMSGPFKVPNLDEMRSRKKKKKVKAKVLEAVEMVITKPTEVVPVDVPDSMTQQIEKVSATKKRKAVVEVEEDAEGVIVKIPHGSTAISDPSSLSKFIKRLLLEEDEQRLIELGPTETSKKIAALSYQVFRFGKLYIFIFFYVEWEKLSEVRFRLWSVASLCKNIRN